MRLMLSEEVLISTLQSRSTRRGRETVEGTGDSSGKRLYYLCLLSFDSVTGGCKECMHTICLTSGKSQKETGRAQDLHVVYLTHCP